ncbi:HAD family hydrolase [Streptomyces sp. NPDC001422]|uniref:HAD family hydrolase n=1 Tax=Streptomyces sp. NPDC001422 TaxID=3364575 RepID=UPI0036BE2F56
MRQESDLGPSRVTVVVFDLDGTLVNSSWIKKGAYLHAMARWTGGAVEDHERAYAIHGTVNRVEQLRRSFAEVNGEPPSEAVSDGLVATYGEFCAAHSGEIKLLPGFRDFYERTHDRYRLLIASNAPCDEVRLLCDRLGITHCFDKTYGHPVSKETALRETTAAYGIPPTSILFVGDRKEDGLAAQAAGTRFSLIAHSGESSPGQIGAVTSFGELIDVLDAAEAAS